MPFVPFARRPCYTGPMELDDTVCFCFHVSYRKLRNYARHHKPPVA